MPCSTASLTPRAPCRAPRPSCCAASSVEPPPRNNDDLLRWCFDNGLRMVKALTLMTIGLYNEPQGAYLPSILY